MRTTGPATGSYPGKEPFGAVRIPEPLPPPSGPGRARRLPSSHPGPAVPIPVLSIESLRQSR